MCLLCDRSFDHTPLFIFLYMGFLICTHTYLQRKRKERREGSREVRMGGSKEGKGGRKGRKLGRMEGRKEEKKVNPEI